MNVHIGKRGLVLLMFGAVWVTIGFGIKDLPQSQSIPLYHPVPMTWQALAWIITGAIAMLLALTNHNEWRGYPILFPMSATQAIGYAFWLPTMHRAWTGVAVWVLMTAILVVIADWAEPPVKVTREEA